MERDRDREEFMNHIQNIENWDVQIFGTVCPRLAERKRLFQRRIENLFLPFESGKQQKSFDWECVKIIYNNIRTDIDRIWTLRLCCSYILKLFCKFNCEDQPLISKIIFIYHQVLNEYENGISFLALCSNCMRLNYPRHYFFEDLKGTSSILRSVNSMIGRNYRFSNGELYSKLTVNAVQEGDYVFLAFLVKYGLTYFPDDELDEVIIQLKRLEYAYKRLNRFENHDNQVRIWSFTEFVMNQLYEETNATNIRRIILILRHVNICLRRRLGNQYYLDYVKCLNLYSLTLHDAAISVKDVEDFLDLIFFDDRAFITKLCLQFQEVFTDRPRFSSPRSLQHLCRCTVRDSIQMRSLLPSMLSILKIPGKIKDYLLIL